MASIAAGHLNGIKPTLPVSPASSGTMAGTLDGAISGSAENVAVDSGHAAFGDNPDAKSNIGSGGQDSTSPTSDGPSRKRRRSRKGLDKRFECSAEGCGKSYSRAEHLYRHQLNHNSKQTFHCEYPDCTRTFVRGDLLKRHMDRHTAKGSQLNRRDSMASQTGPPTNSLANSPEANRPVVSFAGGHPQIPYQQHHDSAPPRVYSPMSHLPAQAYPNGTSASESYMQDSGYAQTHPHSMPQSPAGHHRPSVSTNLPAYAGILSPMSSQQGYPTHPHGSPHTTPNGFVPHQQVLPMNLPPAQYSPHTPGAPSRESENRPYPATTSATREYQNQPQNQNSEMMILGDLAMPGTAPIFGGDGDLSKSPYAGMPEDFMAFLFNSPPGDGSSTSQVSVQNPYANYVDLQSNQYSLTYFGAEGGGSGMNFFQSNPQQIMAVTNLLDQNVPENTISEEKSQQIFDLIKDRFHENEHAPVERKRDSILEGNRSDGDHMLSKRMMQAYIGSYWHHFSDQIPILHKPTFSPENTPNLLLLAMMTIGAACLDRTHGQKVTQAGAKLSNFLAWNLRWETFRDVSFRPPAKLWVFQTLILLELYEKMYSTRELHERAHIHHATTITLMRRGRSLIGKSTLDSPPNPRESANGAQHSSSSGGTPTPEQWWNQWIMNESTRRTAFAAFVIDSIHATMFGHSAVMVAHEMRLPLPCDEALWRATSGAEVGRIEASLLGSGIKPMTFLEGLKRTLSHQEVRTNSFGRTVLMAGLLSVTWHMHQRDLQVNVLGGGVVQALGGRDKWRATLTRAYDSWRSDYDHALNRNGTSTDAGRYDTSKKSEFNIVFESRTALHHLAHMAMHADIVDCQMFARAKRLLGRTIGLPEFGSAQRRIKDHWAPSARARDATYYALKFLCSVLIPEDMVSSHAGGYHQDEPYDAGDDVLLNRPWVLYFAALVVWCYGFALEGPCASTPSPTTREEKRRQMREYLLKFGSITDPSELRAMKGVNCNTGMLMVLKDSFENTRWELLHEGSNLLSNCIILNTGGTIA